MSSKTPEDSVSDPKPSSATTGDASSTPSEEDEGGLMPMLLIGGAIIAVVAALIFWPTSEEPTGMSGKSAKTQAAASSPQGRAAAAGGPPGGVQPRAVDEPTRRPPQPKLNPAISLPEGGAAPAMPEPEVVPEFEDVAEEIAYYERKLALATEALERRKKNVERMETVRERAQQSPNAEKDLEVYESRKKIVEDNLAIAQEKVDELEAKLEELRG